MAETKGEKVLVAKVLSSEEAQALDTEDWFELVKVAAGSLLTDKGEIVIRKSGNEVVVMLQSGHHEVPPDHL